MNLDYCNVDIKEWYSYNNFKPSLLQKIVWFFWHTIFSMKYYKYKKIERQDIITY